jgi:SOS-response transcriptional repressor LexA
LDRVKSNACGPIRSIANNRDMKLSTDVRTEKEAAALRELWDARKEKRSQEAFGAEFGLGTQGMVWQYLNGKRPLNLKAAIAFATELGVKISDFSPRLEKLRQVLASGVPEDDQRAINVEFERSAGSRLPLISWVRAGVKDEANEPFAPGAADEWFDFDTAASTSAFCLRVRGDSMVNPSGAEPTFPDGCIIGVEPRRRPKSREFAVFRFNDSDEATFKQYFIEGGLKYLKPLNPSYPTIPISPDVQLVGTVFEKRIVSRY